MTPTPAELLTQLRDIHLPPGVSFWPPAPGWWGSALLLITLTGGIIWWRNRQKKPHPPKPTAWLQTALAEVNRLEHEFSLHGDGTLLARELSRLLKQAAMLCFDRSQVAPLWGESWLAFLEASSGEKAFTNGAGQSLGEAGYRPAIAVEPQPLLDLTRRWLGHIMGAPRP